MTQQATPNGDALDREIDAHARALQSGSAGDPLDKEIAAAAGEGEREDYGKGLATSIGQGASFGLADEIIGGLGATHPLNLFRKGASVFDSDEYHSIRDRIRGVDETFAHEHPVVHTAGELAGGIATGGVFGAARRSAAGLALEGAGMGAAAGAGNADGDLGDRAKGALLGGAAGAVAAPVLGRLVPKVGGAAIDALGIRPEKAGRFARMLGVHGSDDLGTADVLQAMERDNLPVDDAITRARANGAPGGADKPEMLLDMGDSGAENVLGTARATHVVPGRGRTIVGKALTDRMESQPERVSEDLEDAFGSGRTNTEQFAEDLADQRRSSAAPLYAKAFAHGAVDNPQINEMLKLPYFQRAWEQAKRLAELDGKKLPEIIRTKQVQEPIIFDGVALTNPDGTPRTIAKTIQEKAELPTVEALHYLKLGLDDVIHSGQRTPLESGGLSPTMARKLLGKQHEFLSALDSEVPTYGQARAQYAGDTRMMRALEAGREEFLTSTRDEVEHHFPQLSPGEQDLYRVGALNAISEQLAKVRDGRDVTAMFRNPLMRDKMSTILPAGEVDNFLNAIAKEGKFAESRNYVMSGSRTAPALAELADANGAAPGAMANAATGRPRGVVMSMLNRMFGRNLQRVGEARAAARAPLLTASGEDLAQRLEAATTGADVAPRGAAARRGTSIAMGDVAGKIAGGDSAPSLAAVADNTSVAPASASSSENPVHKELARVGADIPTLRRRKDESSRAFRSRRDRFDARLDFDLAMLVNSEPYQGVSDAVKAGHLRPDEADHVRRALLEQRIRATRREFGSL